MTIEGLNKLEKENATLIHFKTLKTNLINVQPKKPNVF